MQTAGVKKNRKKAQPCPTDGKIEDTKGIANLRRIRISCVAKIKKLLLTRNMFGFTVCLITSSLATQKEVPTPTNRKKAPTILPQ